MFKEHDDKKKAGQTDKWHTLAYESTIFSPEKVEGKWFYDGFKESPEYSGPW